ncbi:hypothetical protein DFH08DRAFT_966446 [Mycena albidolilacea]|uniref:Uncharacterized protein n=1 Tax=Mycena albidolilacea TaxID=1033008 RepID=A0AAD6ZP11_9AGAR|nr:hypothetical protein DFH08DRAFT_966446 [Mycena albidolilacea]
MERKLPDVRRFLSPSYLRFLSSFLLFFFNPLPMLARATPDHDLAPLSARPCALLRTRQVKAHPPPRAHAPPRAPGLCPRHPPALRARAMPNSAFFRVKSLPLLDPDQVPIFAGCGADVGVDRAPGCGLRFLHANARAVVA